MDALLPPQMAERAETIGVAKASMDAPRLFVLAVLAGAFIAVRNLRRFWRAPRRHGLCSGPAEDHAGIAGAWL